MAEKVDKADSGDAGTAPAETDAVAQASLKTLVEAPAIGPVYQALSHSSGMLFENAVNAQQQNAITAQAVTTQCIMALLGDAKPVQNPTRGKT